MYFKSRTESVHFSRYFLSMRFIRPFSFPFHKDLPRDVYNGISPKFHFSISLTQIYDCAVTVLYNLVSIQNKIPLFLCLPSKLYLPNFTSLSVVVQPYKDWFYGMCHPVLNLFVCLCVKL